MRNNFADMLKRHLRKRDKLRSRLLTARVRWTQGEKSNICRALVGGLVTAAELTAAHGLSEDELAEWLRRYASRGVNGLKQQRRAA